MFDRLLGRVVGVLSGLSEFAIALMAVMITLDVVTRLFFNYIVDGGAEIVTRYLMVALSFLPLAHITRADDHLAAQIFTDYLPLRARAILEGVIGILLFFFMVLVTWQTTIAAIDKTQLGEIVQAARLHVIVWPARWFLPIGCGVMAICALAVAIEKFRGKRGAAASTEQKELKSIDA